MISTVAVLAVALTTESGPSGEDADQVGQPRDVGSPIPRQLDLDAEAKAFVFNALAKPVDIGDIAAAVQSQEQAAELYLASRLAIDPDQAAEKAYLQELAHRLKLPAELVTHLERQARAALAVPAA